MKSRVDDFVAVAMVQANQTRGRHIMMTMGSDFQYEDPFKSEVPEVEAVAVRAPSFAKRLCRMLSRGSTTWTS